MAAKFAVQMPDCNRFERQQIRTVKEFEHLRIPGFAMVGTERLKEGFKLATFEKLKSEKLFRTKRAPHLWSTVFGLRKLNAY